MTEFTPDPNSPRALRDAMGRFATGVTIVTAQVSEEPIGMTVNSFTSVSLSPPLVLWSPAKTSARFGAFYRATEFAIHVLGADQAALALQFAQTEPEFDPALWQLDAGNPPLLTQFAARFVCKTFAQHDAGDHVLIIGEVTRAAIGDEDMLVFAAGKFGSFHPS